MTLQNKPYPYTVLLFKPSETLINSHAPYLTDGWQQRGGAVC